jgi:hypothetical protein
VQLTASNAIVAVDVTGRMPNGVTPVARIAGVEPGGGPGSYFQLSLRNQKLTSISGTYGAPGILVLQQITLMTDGTTAPHYLTVGSGGVRPFRYDVPPDFKLVGFFGATGGVIDSIGFIFRSP